MRVKLNKLLLNLFMMSYFLIILCFVKGCVVVDPFAGLLVSGDDLEAALGTSEMVIIDARSAGYESGHIPGAISLKWGDYVNDAKNLKPLSELEAQLGAVGLSRDMVFVIYDDTTVSWGAAGRVFWMLEYLGCTKAHILNGGWDKWVADGRATETTVNTLFPSVFVAEVKEDILVDKNHIQSRMSDDDVIIIDSRTDEEFNGWALYGETRGGHIPGAVQIPYAWFFKEDKTILDYQDLKNMLESRGITTDKEITSYCTAGIRSGFVYFILRLLGYTKCSNYDGSMYEWSADSSLPMEKMEYYEKLVYPAWVDALIAGGNPGTPDTPPTYPGNGYVILDLTTWDYDSGHIPGAIKVDWKEFNKGGTENYPPSIPEDANLKDPEEMQALLEEIGIDHDTTVVIYCTWATLYGRVAWALMCAGVEDIRILNGGLTEWKAYGGAVETTANPRTSITYTGTIPVPETTEFYATTADMVLYMNDPNVVLVDTRTWDEFTGADDYHEYITVPGRIPGSVFYWYEYTLDGTDGEDPTLRAYTEVEQEWQALGVTQSKKLAFICTIGQRSGYACWYASYLLGYPDAQNYDAGWFEWIEDPTRPVAVGEP